MLTSLRASPSVVLVGRRRDAELATVQSTLRQAGVPCLRVDIDRLDDLEVIFRPASPRFLHVEGRTVSPTVVWGRDLSPRAMSGEPGKAHDTFANDSWAVSPGAVSGDPGQIEATFVGDSRAAFLEQMANVSGAFFPGYEPGRLRQLADAKAFGIRIPNSVVATDPDRAPRSWSRVVVKALGQHYVEYPAGMVNWFWPRIWDRTDPLPWPRAGVPALLQEYVEHTSELRVFFVGGKLCAFRVEKRLPTDLWLTEDSVAVTPVLPPPAVRIAATALANGWGLMYGAFDFLVSDGEPVFLEVNADGGWRWFERKAGVAPVTAIVCRVVADMHREIEKGHGAGGLGYRFDPVTFLAGWADPP
jgi:hypothetical protein